MKKNEVKIGGLYAAKVSDKLVTVRIDSAHDSGGWNASNMRTGNRIRIKSAQRLRGAPKNPGKGGTSEATKAAIAKDDKAKAADTAAAAKKANGEQKPRRVSAIYAAAQVLERAGKPMRAKDLITAMAEQNLWKSPAGKTPWATLYAAMMRESRDKGSASRFRKVDRGMFAFNA